MVADGVEDPLAHDGGEQLLNEQGQEDAADGSEVEVVHEEDGLELERLPAAHPLPAAEDYDVVDDHEDGRLLQRGHGRLARHELELIGRVAGDVLEGLVEDGPQVDAEGPVERGDWQGLEESRRSCTRHGVGCAGRFGLIYLGIDSGGARDRSIKLEAAGGQDTMRCGSRRA